ncbi:MAG: hypothetical protein ACRC4W_07455 [Treponemataceae bacterium]
MHIANIRLPFLIIILSSLTTFFFSTERIRFPLWTMLDAEPSVEYKSALDAKFYQYAVDEMKVLAPFVIEGIIYGWKFSYTPSDRLRNVKEFFSFEPLYILPKDDKNLMYSDAILEDNKLICWIEYKQDEQAALKRNAWTSVLFKKIRGRGNSALSNGVAGIKAACSSAVKNAVHEFTRTIQKNKPKEINGVVVLQNFPQIIASSGKFVATADFYVRIDEIIPYTQF